MQRCKLFVNISRIFFFRTTNAFESFQRTYNNLQLDNYHLHVHLIIMFLQETRAEKITKFKSNQN